MHSKVPYKPYLISYARKLRKELTYAEVRLWKQLKDYAMMGYDFHRQISLLDFIADFYCEELMLVIEVDGITHHEKAAVIKDNIKEEELNKFGITVIRFSDREVIKDVANVMRALENYIFAFEEKNGIRDNVLKRRNKMGGG